MEKDTIKDKMHNMSEKAKEKVCELKEGIRESAEKAKLKAHEMKEDIK